MIISFTPLFKGDLNFFQFGPVNKELLNVLSKAKAVIFPPTITSELYFLAKSLKIPIFPEYTLRFLYPGKIGQILMFKALNLPHPETLIIPRLCGIEENPYLKNFKFPDSPFVLKGNWGNEGTEVFLIQKKEDLNKILKLIKSWEREGRFGFLIQEYIPTEFDARVVIIGKRKLIFFRKGGFKKNIVQEGEIIPCPKKGLKKALNELTEEIIKKTGFNLVAIDFLFKNEKPLINELNFVFGRRTIGEKKYRVLLKKAIKEFLYSVL